MDKSLKIIQTLAKLGRILSKIVFIFCIVSVIICAVAIVTFVLDGQELIQLDGITIHGLIENEENLSKGTILGEMAVGFFMLAGNIIIAKFAEKYFENELKDGTPFTERGANEMRRLGIITICVSAGTAILASIAFAVIKAMIPDTVVPDVNGFISLGTGLALLALSVVFRYGSTLIVPEPTAEPAPLEVPQQTENND
ncbi:MAG: hypothetical protein MJ147_10400 [Clostridia bacterium]|nr:hypothetical protein [Clostridia bacterium]